MKSSCGQRCPTQPSTAPSGLALETELLKMCAITYVISTTLFASTFKYWASVLFCRSRLAIAPCNLQAETKINEISVVYDRGTCK